MLLVHARYKVRERQRKKVDAGRKKQPVHAKHKPKRRQREERINAELKAGDARNNKIQKR